MVQSFKPPKNHVVHCFFFYNYICHKKFKSSYSLLIFTNMIRLYQKVTLYKPIFIITMVYFKILPFKVLSTWVNSLLLPRDFFHFSKHLKDQDLFTDNALDQHHFQNPITPQEKFGRRPVLNIRAHPR